MDSKTKIVFIGAGSTIFAKSLLFDILSFPELMVSHSDFDEW
jgi:alpha-galactosidase/6-phospho-beta-glucosidase family protein